MFGQQSNNVVRTFVSLYLLKRPLRPFKSIEVRPCFVIINLDSLREHVCAGSYLYISILQRAAPRQHFITVTHQRRQFNFFHSFNRQTSAQCCVMLVMLVTIVSYFKACQSGPVLA